MGKKLKNREQKIELQNQQIDNFKKEYDEYVPDDDYLMKLTELRKSTGNIKQLRKKHRGMEKK